MGGNLVLLVVAVVAPSVLFWVLLRVPRTVDALGAHLRRRRGPRSNSLPIERLAADLRRVHQALNEFSPGTPAVRRRAARQAYDALLVQACQAVDVPHRLDTLAEGVDREVERLRVEEALQDAGVRVS